VSNELVESNPNSAAAQISNASSGIQANIGNVPADPDTTPAMSVSAPSINESFDSVSAPPDVVPIEITNDGAAGSQLQPSLITGDPTTIGLPSAPIAAIGAGNTQTVQVQISPRALANGDTQELIGVADPNADEGFEFIPVNIQVGQLAPAAPPSGGGVTPPTPTPQPNPPGLIGTYAGTYTSTAGNGSMVLTITGTHANPNGNSGLPGLDGTVTLQNVGGQTIAGPLQAFIDTASGSLFGGLGDNSFQFGDGATLAGNKATGNFVFFVSPTLNGHGAFDLTRQ
jgi:hypothetical protein